MVRGFFTIYKNSKEYYSKTVRNLALYREKLYASKRQHGPLRSRNVNFLHFFMFASIG